MVDATAIKGDRNDLILDAGLIGPVGVVSLEEASACFAEEARPPALGAVSDDFSGIAILTKDSLVGHFDEF